MPAPPARPASHQFPAHMLAPRQSFQVEVDTPRNVDDAVDSVLAGGWPEVNSYSERTHSALRRDIARGIAEELFPHLFEPVIAAAERIKGLVVETRFDVATRLSQELNNTILLKREDTQKIKSFKGRGAAYKITGLSEADRSRGVIAGSAGNHGQGVADVAQQLGIPATIVMPEGVPDIKRQQVAAYGARVVLRGESFTDAYAHSLELQKKENLTYVEPFNDLEVILGQATVGLEMLRERPDMTHVVVPVGGGGLIGGIAQYLKSVRPDIRVIGAQYDQSDAVVQSIALGERVKLDYVGKLADGVAVKEPGELTLRLIRDHVDELLVIPEAAIRLAMDDIYQETRVYPEAAGAIGLAGAKQLIERDDLRRAVIGTIITGSNISPEMIAYNSREVEFLRGKRTSLYIGLPEVPGALRRLCETGLGSRNIQKFEYTYSDDSDAVIAITLGTADTSDREALTENLRAQGYAYKDISDDELLRHHAEHLNGGRSSYTGPATSFEIKFPERPNALLNFLRVMGDDFNIGRFHYEENGSDTGQVLITYHTADRSELQKRLRATGYQYAEIDLEPLLGKQAVR